MGEQHARRGRPDTRVTSQGISQHCQPVDGDGGVGIHQRHHVGVGEPGHTAHGLIGSHEAQVGGVGDQVDTVAETLHHRCHAAVGAGVVDHHHVDGAVEALGQNRLDARHHQVAAVVVHHHEPGDGHGGLSRRGRRATPPCGPTPR